MEDFSISQQDLVGEKTGKITNDYSILNPPLGKGSHFISITLIF